MTGKVNPLIFLLATLVLLSGCVSGPSPLLIPGSMDEEPGCVLLYPDAEWECVHSIEAVIRKGVSTTFLGVTRGDPGSRNLRSALLTPEGFVLFEAELRSGVIAVARAFPPFDDPAFATGMMEDVSRLFFPPLGKPLHWGKKPDGTAVCIWEGVDGSRTEAYLFGEAGGKILVHDAEGDRTREVVFKGPFIRGFASSVEIRAFKPSSYRLDMTLLRPAS